MKIVVDTSAIIALVTESEYKQKIGTHLKDADVIAPYSLHFEMGNAFSAMFKRKKISLLDAQKAMELYSSFPIEFHQVDFSRVLEISHQENMYAYDAYMIFLAEKFSCPLCTLDSALIVHAKRYGIFSFSL